MNRGEVWWVDDPEIGRRPHLVLTRQTSIPILTAYIAVPTTQSVRDIPTEVRLDTEDGMPQECVLSLDSIAVVPRGFFVERICRIRGERMVEVCRALQVATGC